MAPALFFYTGFLVGPMLFTLYTSFFQWDGLSADMTFVGLRNYMRILFEDEVSQLALRNNLWWTAGAVTVPTAIGLMLAVGLNSVSAVSKFMRTLYYMPAVLPLISVGLIWGWMYNPHFGVINVFLKSAGLGFLAGGWLSSYEMALGSGRHSWFFSSYRGLSPGPRRRLRRPAWTVPAAGRASAT